MNSVLKLCWIIRDWFGPSRATLRAIHLERKSNLNEIESFLMDSVYSLDKARALIPSCCSGLHRYERLIREETDRLRLKAFYYMKRGQQYWGAVGE